MKSVSVKSAATDGGLPLCDLLSDEPEDVVGGDGLVVETDVERRGDALVVRRRVHNRGEQPSPPLNGPVPLRLLFNHPWPNWELLAARGGTTELYWPPQAFETRHITAVRHFALRCDREGRSSNGDLPLLIGLATDRQEGFFCGLEWSGHWKWEAGRRGADQFQVAGSLHFCGMTVEPGETLELPAAHVGFFRGTLEDGTNALRRHIYEQVCPTYLGEPVLPSVSYDSWFGLENGCTQETIREQVDRAAELGVEVFVHDAGWFPGGFPHGVGNWSGADPEKWPEGLEPLADYVRSKGMEFGLWFEIERACPGTEALRERPELFIEPPAARFFHRGEWKQFANLNLARRDAQDWAIETMSAWISRLDLRWSRFDYNIEPHDYWLAEDPTGKIQLPYVAGLYRVLDVLMERHPTWRVEACASGGRRIDLGTLGRAHAIWISDESFSPANCRWMQARASRFLPGHLLNSSVAVNRGAGDAPFDDTAVLSRMLGKLSFDGDIASWSPEFTRRVAVLVRRFKQLRHLFVQDFYQLLPTPREPEEAEAVQFASRDGSEHAVFAFAGSRPAELQLPLRALRQDRPYAVSPEAEWREGSLFVSLDAGTGGLWHVTEG